MFQKFLMLGLATFVFGLFSTAIPVEAKTSGGLAHAKALKSAKIRAYRFGPYATLRRANEVANYARSYGYNAQIIYGMSDGSRVYYVDVW